jgi:hypothetical protein
VTAELLRDLREARASERVECFDKIKRAILKDSDYETAEREEIVSKVFDVLKPLDEEPMTAEAERDRMREALEWYADENRYRAAISRYGPRIPADAEEDRGRRARRALERP